MTSTISPELLEAIRECCRSEVKKELNDIRDELEILKASHPKEVDLDGFTFGKEASAKSSRQLTVDESADEGYALLSKQDEEPESDAHIVGSDLRRVRVTLTDMNSPLEGKTEEYLDIIRNASDETGLDSDVWGACLFVIVKDVADVAMGEITTENLMRLLMILLCVSLNLFLQFAFLYWIGSLVLLPNIRNLQETYREYHHRAFKSGEFVSEEFEALGEHRVQLCEMAMTKIFFMSAVLFLWTARCISELRGIFRRARSINNLPRLPAGVAPTHMVHEVKLEVQDFLQEKKNMVVCLNRSSIFWLYFLIFIPRTIIAISLLILGAAFLTATQSFTDLILNSLAMSFIYDIDELLMFSFLPERLKQNLEHTKIMTPADEFKKHLSPQELDLRDVKAAYKRSLVYLLVVISIVVVWFLFQPIIPGYSFDVSEQCNQFLSNISDVSCLPWEKNCFPTSDYAGNSST